MKMRLHVVVIAAASLLSAVPLLVAQDSSSSNPSKPPETVAAQPGKDSYAVSLGTGELINLSGDPQTRAVASGAEQQNGEYADGLPLRSKGKAFAGQLFYGLSAASVYSSSLPGSGTGSTVSTTVSPYVSLLKPTRTGSYLLQYLAVVAPHDAITQGSELFQTGGVLVQGALSRRLTWVVSTTGSYGSESARLQGPLAYSLVQSTPMVSAGSTAVLLRPGNVSFFESLAGMSWRKSARETMGFALGHTYSGVEGDSSVAGSVASHSNILGVKVSYDRTISSRYTLLGYGEADTLLRTPICRTYGGGAGFSVRVNQVVGLRFEGGPQFSSKACGGAQGASFSASVAVNLMRHDRIYASANRTFSTAYLSTGTWEDNLGAGFAKDMGRLRFTTDAGWVRAEQLSPIPTYHGYFVAPRVSYRLSESLGVSAAYRNFHGSGGLLGSGAASFASVSLDWHPAGKHLK